jgi:hypothetical protein
MKKLVFFILFMMAFTAISAAEPWSTQDKWLEAGDQLALAMDWRQTSEIHKLSGKHEMNSVLGLHPQQSTINLYFLGAGLAHAEVANMLHGKWRTAWQCTWIAIEVGQVQHNYALGIRLNY